MSPKNVAHTGSGANISNWCFWTCIFNAIFSHEGYPTVAMFFYKCDTLLDVVTVTYLYKAFLVW